MASAKDIVVSPIAAADAAACIRRLHYSHSVCSNSQLHFGVFLDGSLEGAMQFGPPLDKRRLIKVVQGTSWSGFLEINRIAFSEALPRNSESRALAFAMRAIRQHYPHVEWVVTFADGTQCGDGTIYRAAGFVLTGIKKNTTIWIGPGGERRTNLSMKLEQRTAGSAGFNGSCSMRQFKEAGWSPMPGFQLQYVFFLNPAARARLAVPEVPFSRIAELGATMYKGVRGKQAMAEAPSAQRRGSGDLHAPKKTPARRRG